MRFSFHFLRSSLVSAVFSTALITGCSGSDIVAPPPVGGIEFIRGIDRSDTVGSSFEDTPLVVEIRDSSGRLVPSGVRVRFAPVMGRNPLNYSDAWPEAFVQKMDQIQPGLVAVEETDGQGKAVVYVRLGRIAGPVRVVVSVPTLGLIDTATYMATPGNAAKIHVVAPDTVIYAGGTYQFRASVTDEYGNPREDTVKWSSNDDRIVISESGLLDNPVVGRYSVTAQAGDWQETAYISVVPQGRIAVFDYSTYSIQAIDLNGTNKRMLVNTLIDGGIGIHPSWIPNSNSVIYTTYVAPLQILHVVNDNLTISPFFSAPPATMSHQAQPIPSRNGEWMYFVAYDTRCMQYEYCIYRSKIDGSAPELLGNSIDPIKTTIQPSPSPDGSKVAFVTGKDEPPRIRVLDAVTKQVSTWSVGGSWPRWSPTGDKIAFLYGDKIATINPDGSGQQILPGDSYSHSSFSWSPDGQWLIVSRQYRLELVNATTGESLILPFSQGMTSPSWK